jgi:DNA-binding NarL/FixJ family response regulator
LPAEIDLLDSDSSFGETLENIYLVCQNRRLLSLPLVVMSGYSQKNYRDLAFAGGADGYLVKPVNFSHMERMLNSFSEDETIAIGEKI